MIKKKLIFKERGRLSRTRAVLVLHILVKSLRYHYRLLLRAVAGKIPELQIKGGIHLRGANRLQGKLERFHHRPHLEEGLLLLP